MDFKTKIIESTISEVSKNSLGKFSTIEIANNAGCSEANVFKLFKTKRNLLLESYLYIDLKLEEKLKIKVPDKIDSYNDYLVFVERFLSKIIDFFIKNKDYAIYYSNFRMSNLYNPEIYLYESHIKHELVHYFQMAEEEFGIYQGINKEVFWTLVFDFVLCLVRREVQEYKNVMLKAPKRNDKMIIEKIFSSIKK